MDDLPVQLERDSPLLFSTACLLAAKHVPRVQKDTVESMYMLVRRLVSTVVFRAPPLDYPSLQALTSLSLFTPTIQSAMPIDSWLVSGMAMSHAVLAFDLNAADFTMLDNSDERLKQLRIWNALCLTNVQYATRSFVYVLAYADETRFSIGNGRPSAVQPRFVDRCSSILTVPNLQSNDIKLLAEVLLYTNTESLLASPSKISFQDFEDFSVAELSSVKSRWSDIFDYPDCLTLKIGYWYCHLLLYRAALSSTETQNEPLKEVALSTSCCILALFQEMEFSTVLDMPDHFFFVVIYAALTLCKFAIGHHLIASTENCLINLAPNDEHIAYRFGTIIAEIRRKAVAAGAESAYTKDSRDPNNDIQNSQFMFDLDSGPEDWRWEAFLSWTNPLYDEAHRGV
jgi:hypothetical protein